MMNKEEQQKGAVIVFGATGGIGSEVCRCLIEDDQQVFLVGHTQEKVDSLAQ